MPAPVNEITATFQVTSIKSSIMTDINNNTNEGITHGQKWTIGDYTFLLQKTDLTGFVLQPTQPLPKGARALPFAMNNLQDTPTLYTVQVDRDSHTNCGEPARFLSHHCNPNGDIIMDKGVYFGWVATRDIEAGETLSFDYNQTEWDITAQFKCLLCTEDDCVGEIRGLKYLTTEQRERRNLRHRLLPYLADLLKEDEERK
eukprot:TRINITY_DN6616_c0_g1_i1.p1 TRINITY_DN6616_c0_g1~~TRINITY_DN6616_c0_g1_i1.p1  ORF type:complete len:201 (+),score=48.01 TRINITY_DN6616_c0_g1_i1:142-744(+)